MLDVVLQGRTENGSLDVGAKLIRAKAHDDCLSQRINADLYAVPEQLYRLAPEFDMGRSECHLRLEKVADPPFVVWEVMLGDVLHNLRSALDRLVYQLAADPQPGSEFPIFKDATAFERKGKGGGAYKIRGLEPETQAAISSMQPFDTPEHPLWVLQQLSNADKHRLGITLEVVPGLPVMEGPQWTDAQVVSEHWEHGPYEDGAVVVIYMLRFTGPHPGA